MRVLYLIDSLIAGGAERSLAALAPWYVRAGIRLDVGYLYDRDNVWRPAIEAAGANVVPLSGRAGMPGSVLRSRRTMRSIRPDLVHTTLFDADVIGRIASLGIGVPVVTSLVNVAYGPEHLANPAIVPWRLRLAQTIDMTTARRVRRFHAVSTSVADVMSERLHIARDRMTVIPRGRDPREMGVRSAARRAVARAALGIPDDVPMLLAVGRHEYQKGFDVLLHALVEVRRSEPDARLVIAGRTGSETRLLRALAEQLGVDTSVSVIGFSEEIPNLLCAADVFVAPSRWEGSPGGVLEAMALESPIVATAIPPIREVVGDGEGALLVSVDDAPALADAIVATLEGDGSAERVAAARARFEARYTIERVAARMIEFYEGVVN